MIIIMVSITTIPKELLEGRKKGVRDIMGAPNEWLTGAYNKHVPKKQHGAAAAGSEEEEGWRKTGRINKYSEQEEGEMGESSSYNDKEMTMMMNFYDLVNTLDPTITYRPTKKEVTALESVEDCLGTFLAFYDMIKGEFSKAGPIHEVYNPGDEFAKTYSLYAGCVVGLEKLGKTGEGDEKGTIITTPDGEGYKNVEINFHLSGDELAGELVELFASDLIVSLKNEEEVDGDVLVSKTRQFLGSVLNQCLEEKDADKYKELAEAVSSHSIKANDMVIEGFSYKLDEEEVESFSDVTWDDVIGNDEFKDSFKSILDKLLLYDPETETNPIKEIGDLPRSIFVYGLPGTGKTMTLKAGANYLQELGQKFGKKVNVVVIDESVKSKYFSESSQRLTEEFLKGTDPGGIGLIFMEDVDAFLPSRDELTDKPEEKAVFETLLNLIQGVKTKNRGNYLIITTTNRPEGVDKALSQRIAQKSIEVNGPKKPEELVGITKLHMRKGLEAGYITVSDAEWEEIGTYALGHGLVGRDVENVCKSLSERAGRDIEIPEEIYTMDIGEQKKALVELWGKINGKDVLNEFKNYGEELVKQGELEERAHHKHKVDEIVTNYRAQEDARGILLDGKEEEGRMEKETVEKKKKRRAGKKTKTE